MPRRLKRLQIPDDLLATEMIVALVGLPKDARLVTSQHQADKRLTWLYFESEEFEEIGQGEETPNLPLMLSERWR